MTTFGMRFKELRNEKDMTQDTLVQIFNDKYHTTFNKSTISQYENDKRKPEVNILENWAEFFGVSIDYLLGRTNIRNYEENTIAAHTDDRTQQLSEEGRKKLDDFIDYLIFEGCIYRLPTRKN